MIINIWKIKNYCQVRDHCHYTDLYRGSAHSICNLKYSVPKKNPTVLHNGYNYKFYHKRVSRRIKKTSACLVENTENHW